MWPRHLICVFWRVRGLLVVVCWTGTKSFLPLHVSSSLSGHTTVWKWMRAWGWSSRGYNWWCGSHQPRELKTLLKELDKGHESIQVRRGESLFQAEGSWKPKILIIMSFLGSEVKLKLTLYSSQIVWHTHTGTCMHTHKWMHTMLQPSPVETKSILCCT